MTELSERAPVVFILTKEENSHIHLNELINHTLTLIVQCVRLNCIIVNSNVMKKNP